MIKNKEIFIENGKYKSKILNDGYQTVLLTMSNGFQWSGANISPELAKLSILVLEKYLADEWDNERLNQD